MAFGQQTLSAVFFGSFSPGEFSNVRLSQRLHNTAFFGISLNYVKLASPENFLTPDFPNWVVVKVKFPVSGVY